MLISILIEFVLQELARLLQQQENKTLTFEEQDRLVAMEAQDKELARMLQERVRVNRIELGKYWEKRFVFIVCCLYIFDQCLRLKFMISCSSITRPNILKIRLKYTTIFV